VRDEAEVRGHRRTYVGALPGRIIHALQRCETRNPLLMLDEVDKNGSRRARHPTAALLPEVLTRAERHLRDHYLRGTFGPLGRHVIATDKQLAPIPDPLLDRMEVIPYGVHARREARDRQTLSPAGQLKETGLQTERANIADGALERLIGENTRGSRRAPARARDQACSAGGARSGRGTGRHHQVTAKNLEKFAGQPKVQSEVRDAVRRWGWPPGSHGRPWAGHHVHRSDSDAGKGLITLTDSWGT